MYHSVHKRRNAVPITASGIFVVEDDLALNEAYSLLLRQAGYEVRTAFNGQEALEVLREWRPSLIFLDLRMPVMDGLSFLRHYMPFKHHATKIIVFSNYDMQHEVDEAYRLGADRYVLKAWASPNELLKIVEQTFMASKANR